MSLAGFGHLRIYKLRGVAPSKIHSDISGRMCRVSSTNWFRLEDCVWNVGGVKLLDDQYRHKRCRCTIRLFLMRWADNVGPGLWRWGCIAAVTVRPSVSQMHCWRVAGTSSQEWWDRSILFWSNKLQCERDNQYVASDFISTFSACLHTVCLSVFSYFMCWLKVKEIIQRSGHDLT